MPANGRLLAALTLFLLLCAALPAKSGGEVTALPPPMDAPVQAAGEVIPVSAWLSDLEHKRALSFERLTDGRFLLTGEYRDGAQGMLRLVALLDLGAKRAQVLWTGRLAFYIKPLIWACGGTLWFLAEEDEKSAPAIWAVDLSTREAWRAEEFLGAKLALLRDAMAENVYYDVACTDDGGLAIEWEEWEPLAILWGQGREAFGLRGEQQIPIDPKQQKDVFSLARLPSLAAALAAAKKGAPLDPLLTASYRRSLTPDSEQSRPDPYWQGGVLHYAPVSSGMTFGPMPSLPVESLGLVLQPFVLYRDPSTGGICPPTPGGATVTSTVSDARCARFSGAYLEDPIDGRLRSVLTHGVGVPGTRDLSGMFFASHTKAEPPGSGFPAPGIALWDLSTAAPVARLVLDADAEAAAKAELSVQIVGLSVDAKGRRVYALGDYGDYGGMKLYVWRF